MIAMKTIYTQVIPYICCNRAETHHLRFAIAHSLRFANPKDCLNMSVRTRRRDMMIDVSLFKQRDICNAWCFETK